MPRNMADKHGLEAWLRKMPKQHGSENMAEKHGWAMLKKRFYSNWPKRLTKCWKNTCQGYDNSFYMVFNNLCEVSCHSNL